MKILFHKKNYRTQLAPAPCVWLRDLLRQRTDPPLAGIWLAMTYPIKNVKILVMFNDLLLKALRKEMVPRPPVWLMRQAGRYLPEYQKIRSKVSFLEMCNNPELACEVSLQPYDRFKLDGVIVFSDILLPAKEMGLKLDFDEGGPKFERAVSSEQDIKNLKIPLANEETYPTLKAISLLKQELKEKVPVIGFSAAPWTLFCYMTEGAGSNNFQKAKRFLYLEPKLSHQLLNKITNTLFLYLTMQVNSGAQVLQLFDTWAGLLSDEEYNMFAIPYLKQLLADLTPLNVPIILYSNNSNHLLQKLSELKLAALSVDWRASLQKVRDLYARDIGLQGNLDPIVLLTNETVVREKTKEMISSLKNWQVGYICNLGHGVLPNTPIDNVHAMIDTVYEFTNETVVAYAR